MSSENSNIFLSHAYYLRCNLTVIMLPDLEAEMVSGAVVVVTTPLKHI